LTGRRGNKLQNVAMSSYIVIAAVLIVFCVATAFAVEP
jgi:hypothetical protein